MNYETLWLLEVTKKNNKQKVILTLSGIFYKAFDDDARFLSDTFWFKIKNEWWHECVWFPKIVIEKYVSELKKLDFWYIIFNKIDGNFVQMQDFHWSKKIAFQEERLHFIENKIEKSDFKSFLKDLWLLIEKYS